VLVHSDDAAVDHGDERALIDSRRQCHITQAVGQPLSHGPHYAASKAGLHGLVHHLALRVARSEVTVNALAPALIAATRMLPVDPGQADPSMPIPVGRLGRPSEVAEMAITMLRNGYLTDKVVALDGGLLPR
jgi:3-oxoacyl-[acyl-carrier protein] reductase